MAMCGWNCVLYIFGILWVCLNWGGILLFCFILSVIIVHVGGFGRVHAKVHMEV